MDARAIDIILKAVIAPVVVWSGVVWSGMEWSGIQLIRMLLCYKVREYNTLGHV